WCVATERTSWLKDFICRLKLADDSSVKNQQIVCPAGNSLRCLPSLRELDLSRNRGLVGGLDRLTFHLPHITHLESLDLHLCCLRHADLDALLQALPSLTALSELNLSSNKVVGGGVHELVSVLPLSQMRRLPLNNCKLNEESFTALCKPSQNNQVTRLLLRPHYINKCTNVSIYVCRLVIEHISSITGLNIYAYVDVSWCKVVGGRLPLLLDALQPSVILELRLSSCSLTTDDLRHLADVCRRGSVSSLRVLDLSYNSSVGDAGWAALFAAGGLGLLEEADVSLRPMTSAPCSAWLPALLGSLPRMPALARLAMQRWTVGSQEGRHPAFHIWNVCMHPLLNTPDERLIRRPL
uniref:Leucine rich repeat containing 31 n=1 Tax=Cyprinodon variegatus TaxID=28743 RepID=A0A3Q2D4F2_CYPVA